MTVSNSTDFASTFVDLFTDARRLLGVNPDEEAVDASELETGRKFFTRMLKAWEAEGIALSLVTEGSLTLVTSTNSYLFGAGGAFTTVPFEIVDARINRSSIDLPMTRMSRSDYQALPNKTVTGYPTQWFYDRQRDNGTLYVWPSPDAAAGTFKFTYRRRVMDVDAGVDNIDLPPEWEEALVNNLARRLIPIYARGGTPEAQQIIVDAERGYQAVKGWDVSADSGSVSISRDD